ncbi:MAG: phosphotransferase [Gammaproteobacteria bacterium]|nr:phosphotransferase [Gammaproteobacteria bacterium]
MMTPVPAVTKVEARQLLTAQYCLSGDLEVLRSERDQNFVVSTDSGRRYVLKITNSGEDPAVTAFQTEALLHIAEVSPDLPVPRVVPNNDGDKSIEFIADDGRSHVVRLLTWLGGTPLLYADRVPGYASMLGTCLAELGHALRDFEHPASGYALLWDLKRAASLRKLVHCVDDADLRALCQRRLDRFESYVLPRLDGVRWQVIHNDLNLGNVLVDSKMPGVFAGFIDFGDLVRSPLIIDVAVACAYLPHDSNDPFSDVVEFVAAYSAVEPLEPEEVDILFDLLLTRSTMTILITHWRVSRHPENRDYILRSEPTAQRMLEKMGNEDHAAVRARLQAANNGH